MTASSAAEPQHDQHDHSDSGNGAVKTRGFMRAIGGMFHRKSARESESGRASLSQAVRPSTSAVSRSASRHQHQLASSSTATTASGSALRAISSEDARKGGGRTSRNPFRKKSSVTSSFYEDHDDASKDSVATAPSDDDDDEDGAYRYQFHFYSGSAEDNSFKPERVHSTVAEIDFNTIRPSLTLQMPVFFSPPKEQEALRRSSILTDPREYELRRGSKTAADLYDDADQEDKAAALQDEPTLWVDGVTF